MFKQFLVGTALLLNAHAQTATAPACDRACMTVLVDRYLARQRRPLH